MERDCMEFDVLIVGAGPAGLSAACRIKQLAMEKTKKSQFVLSRKVQKSVRTFSLARCLNRAVWRSCFLIGKQWVPH